MSTEMTPMQCLELQAQSNPRVREGMNMLKAMRSGVYGWKNGRYGRIGDRVTERRGA